MDVAQSAGSGDQGSPVSRGNPIRPASTRPVRRRGATIRLAVRCLREAILRAPLELFRSAPVSRVRFAKVYETSILRTRAFRKFVEHVGIDGLVNRERHERLS